MVEQFQIIRVYKPSHIFSFVLAKTLNKMKLCLME